MTSSRVEFAPAASRDLRKLDPHVRAKLFQAATVLTQGPYPSGGSRIKFLVGVTPPHFRLRIGDYRLIYRLEESRVVVVRVSHRREAYR